MTSFASYERDIIFLSCYATSPPAPFIQQSVTSGGNKTWSISCHKTVVFSFFFKKVIRMATFTWLREIDTALLLTYLNINESYQINTTTLIPWENLFAPSKTVAFVNGNDKRFT